MKRIGRALMGLILGLMIVVGSSHNLAYAQTASASACKDRARDGMSLLFAFPTWYQYLELDTSTCEVSKFDFPGDLWKIALALIEILLRLAGFVAFIFTIFGGFKFVLSRGNPQEAAKARQTIIDALIGMGIASVATVLVAFLGRTLA